MRLPRAALLLIAPALLAVGVAGCTNTPTPGPSQSATPTPTVPPCPVGSWKSTSVAASPTAAGVTLTFDGGSGVLVRIGSDGAVNADFSKMQPVTFTTQVAGAQVRGEIVYQGTLTGSVTPPNSSPSAPGGATPTTASPTSAGSAPTPSATTSGAGGTSGAWQPVGSPNVGDLRLTAKLTQPTALSLFNDLKLSDVTAAQSAQAGNAIDLQPLLRPGTFQCNGENDLVITTSGGNGPSITWTLTRA